MSCLFGLFKLIYVIATFLVLLFHIFYIYFYLQNFHEAKAFFNHNQFAHFMGMFLGLLFRLSGLLSACKEKIALTCTYSLFLVLILLLSRKVDIIFALHACTAALALLFVLVLKYHRHKQRRRLLRHQVPNRGTSRISSNSNHEPPHTLDVNLIHGPAACATNVIPTAPPFESPSITSFDSTIITNNNHSGHINPNYDPNYTNLNHTPPPSYKEIFESK